MAVLQQQIIISPKHPLSWSLETIRTSRNLKLSILCIVDNLAGGLGVEVHPIEAYKYVPALSCLDPICLQLSTGNSNPPVFPFWKNRYQFLFFDHFAKQCGFHLSSIHVPSNTRSNLVCLSRWLRSYLYSYQTMKLIMSFLMICVFKYGPMCCVCW